MTRGTTVLVAVLLAALAGVAQPEADEPPLQDGAYEVQVRLELPNVLSWAAARSTATICLPDSSPNGALPVLSRNNPLARCPASNVERDGATLTFDILCEGRGAAWAKAVYKLLPSAFEGRIAMVMGGKNMTMTEVQTGRRIGSCAPAGAPARLIRRSCRSRGGKGQAWPSPAFLPLRPAPGPWPRARPKGRAARRRGS